LKEEEGLGNPFSKVGGGKTSIGGLRQEERQRLRREKEGIRGGPRGVFIAPAWSQRTCPLLYGLVRYTGHVQYLADLSACHLLEGVKG